MLPLFFMLVAALEGAPSASAGDVVRFKTRHVLVSDAAGIPLFLGTRKFVLEKAHNEAGTVVRYDAVSHRVRVSTVGTELWLSCAELEPMAVSCSRNAVPRRRLRGADGSPGDEAMISAGLPMCPGDPRCPKGE